MSKRPIVKLPESVLRRPTETIPEADFGSEKLKALIRDMQDTLRAAPDGVGLAAPQIGSSLSIFLVSEEAAVIDRGEDRSEEREKPRAWAHHVFINPKIVKRARRKITMPEGCLSVPQRFGLVSRPEKISLVWQDATGKRHQRGFTKFFARVIQHEMDHLEGRLIVDHMKPLSAGLPETDRKHQAP